MRPSGAWGSQQRQLPSVKTGCGQALSDNGPARGGPPRTCAQWQLQHGARQRASRQCRGLPAAVKQVRGQILSVKASQRTAKTARRRNTNRGNSAAHKSRHNFGPASRPSGRIGGLRRRAATSPGASHRTAKFHHQSRARRRRGTAHWLPRRFVIKMKKNDVRLDPLPSPVGVANSRKEWLFRFANTLHACAVPAARTSTGLASQSKVGHSSFLRG